MPRRRLGGTRNGVVGARLRMRDARIIIVHEYPMRRSFQVIVLTILDGPNERPDRECQEDQADGDEQIENIHARVPGLSPQRMTTGACDVS